MSSEQTIRVSIFDETLGIPVFKEVPLSRSQERTEPEKKFDNIILLNVIGLILAVILFIYVVVSGGILKGIIIILCTIVLTPLIFFVMVISATKGKSAAEASGDAALIIFTPVISAFTSVILTIIMAIYIFITPTPSTIV